MPGLVGQFDVGFALPLGHCSIWLRNAAGGSTGDRDDPLANFFFGGFGNNYVDNGEAKRYREVLSMPGFEIDAVGGRTFAKSMLELNLPPLRFEALGTPASTCRGRARRCSRRRCPRTSRTATFARPSTTSACRSTSRLHVMHRLPMMLSFGYAHGFADGGRDDDEFMISLKVL